MKVIVSVMLNNLFQLVLEIQTKSVNKGLFHTIIFSLNCLFCIVTDLLTSPSNVPCGK